MTDLFLIIGLVCGLLTLAGRGLLSVEMTGLSLFALVALLGFARARAINLGVLMLKLGLAVLAVAALAKVWDLDWVGSSAAITAILAVVIAMSAVYWMTRGVFQRRNQGRR